MEIDLAILIPFVVITVCTFFFLQALSQLLHDPIREWLAKSTYADRTERADREEVSELPATQLAPPDSARDDLDKDLRRAGFYRPSAREEFLAVRTALAALVLILAGSLAVIVGPGQHDMAMRVVGIGLLATALCVALPRIYLQIRANRRMKRVVRGLPDALDMISMCVIGGMSLLDALSRVSRELFFAHPDLAVELFIVRRQSELTSLEGAFELLAKRIDAAEILALSALIAHGQRLGVNVAESIRDQADSMRLKWRQTADERANKAGIKLLFPVSLCLLPAVFILLWGPAVLELWNFLSTFDTEALPGP